VDKPAHAGEPDRFRDIACPGDIDVEACVERLLHAVADQAGGMNDSVGFALDDGRGQVGQVGDIAAHQQMAFVAELELEEVGARLRVDENDLFSARDGVLGECGADQPRAGHECGHASSLSASGIGQTATSGILVEK
jgi:hypothetical protein